MVVLSLHCVRETHCTDAHIYLVLALLPLYPPEAPLNMPSLSFSLVLVVLLFDIALGPSVQKLTV